MQDIRYRATVTVNRSGGKSYKCTRLTALGCIRGYYFVSRTIQRASLCGYPRDQDCRVGRVVEISRGPRLHWIH